MATDFIKPKSNSNSRIADDTGVYQAICDTDVAGWTKGDVFILAIIAECATHNGATEEIELEWQEDGGAWNKLQAAAGALRQGDAPGSGAFADCTSPSTHMTDGLCGCDAPLGDSHEINLNSSASMFAPSKDDVVDMYFAIDTSNASGGSQYSFRLYSVTGTAVIGDGTAWNAQITILSGLTDDAEDLLANADIQQSDSAELLGKAVIRHSAFAELLGKAVIRHMGTPVELLGRAEVRQPGSAELLGNAIIRNVGFAELLGEAVIRNIGSADFLGNAIIRNVGSAELLGNAVIRYSASAELLGKFEAQAIAELLGKAEIQQSESAELLGKAEIQQSGSAELLGKTIIVRGGAWLSGWSYRKEVTLVEQSSGTYNDLPTIITAAYNAHMKSDFSDCRFTESDGTTLIAYGIKDKTDEVECEFVITQDYTSGVSLTVYLYYGNAGASDASVDYTSWCQDWYINNGFGKNPSALHGSGDCAIYDHSETDDIPSWAEHVFGGCTANGGYRALYGHVKINGTGVPWASTVLCFGIGNALKLRWDKYNCTQQMYDHASFVKGASNTVQWGHYSGSNTGFWVSWYPLEPSVSFGAEEVPSDAVDLPAQFEVGQGSIVLLARFDVGQGSAELLGGFDVGQGSAELLGGFEVGQGSAELFGGFEAQATAELLGNAVIRHSDTAELQGKEIIRQSDTIELLGKFEAQATADLLGKAEIQQSDSAELLSKFEAQATTELLGKTVIRHSGSAELLGKGFVSDIGSAELLGNAVIRHSASAELLGRFEAQATAELLGNAVIRHSASAELLGKFEAQATTELLGKTVIRHSASAELLGRFEAQATAELLGKAEIQHSGSAELLGKFEAQATAELLGKFEAQATAELLGKTVIRHSGSAELLGKFDVGQDSADLGAEFRVSCPRLMGSNWQRKMWYDGTYYWRGRYDPVGDELIFEYIAAAGLTGNVWTKNAAASIDASGFSGADADFTVRDATGGIPFTIHYSDGVDTWVAESNEASATGWAWENLTKVFDGTDPDWYRSPNLCADQQGAPKLWATAVFYDQSEGKQWVKASLETASGDITGWDAAVDVSNVDNTNTIYGESIRSMGAAAGVDVMVVYKEGAALRSRYYDGDWDDVIEDIDITALAGKSQWDFEQGETPKVGHVLYVDANSSVQWKERDSGAASVWSAGEEVGADTSHTHTGLGIIEHGSGWLWATWANRDTVEVEYRLHLCAPETWFPLLVNDPLTFDATSAEVSTTTIAQLQTPDNQPAGSAVIITWIGETAPTTPCAAGWGIIVPPAHEDLKAIFEVGQDSVDLPARFETQATAELLGKANIIHSEDLLGKFEAQVTVELLSKAVIRHSDSADFLGKAVIRNIGSAELSGKANIRHSDTAELLSNFRVPCPRLMGGNWQRKMWYDGTYYWRGRYDPVGDELIFEYIAAAGLTGNVWTKNANASIDASGFAADAYDADFTVRGGESGIPTTIHYSDGVDTWVAQSDETSPTGWAWQNTTKVFDGTAPDSYRRVNLSANRADTPALWATAVFIQNVYESKQWVQTRKQTTSMDATAWDPAVAVSNVDNTDTIYGCSSRSMGASGATADDVLWVYKEGDALRSRFFTGVWQDIQNIETSTYSGKAMFDFEHGEVAGENEGHVIYVEADGTIKWRERDAGATDAWSAAETLDSGTTGHGGVGIVEHGSGWLWVVWKEANVLQYRIHLCVPETWYPVLASEPTTFNVASDAVVTTSTVAQPNTPDQVPVSEAVPICWIGETAPTTPCAVGWGILTEFTTASLKGILNVRQLTSTDLYARFEVGQDSAELLGNAVIRHVGTPVELLGNAVIRHSASAGLLSKFEVGQDSADLLSHFEVGQDSVDFLARFEVGQGAEELPGRAAIRHSASSDLKFSLYVSPWYLTAAEMLIGGRDRRMDLGGLDREMVVGGRNRRMKIK